MFALPFLRRDLPALRGIRVHLRAPASEDYEEWAELRQKSRSFLEPWEPRWGRDEFERRAWRQRLRRYREELDNGTGFTFFILDNATNRLTGGISVGNIRRGVAQTAQIGYWMGEEFAGQGRMLDALELVVPFGLDTLRLHRIEAACIPDNQRSVRLLEKAGFQREGLLRSYLRINGTWQDHYLYALVAGDDEAKR